MSFLIFPPDLPLNKKLEAVMVMKPHKSLPSAFKYNKEFIPPELSKVVVTGFNYQGKELYVQIKWGKPTQQGELNRRHLWTLTQFNVLYKHHKNQEIFLTKKTK